MHIPGLFDARNNCVFENKHKHINIHAYMQISQIFERSHISIKSHMPVSLCKSHRTQDTIPCVWITCFPFLYCFPNFVCETCLDCFSPINCRNHRTTTERNVSQNLYIRMWVEDLFWLLPEIDWSKQWRNRLGVELGNRKKRKEMRQKHQKETQFPPPNVVLDFFCLRITWSLWTPPEF